MFKDKRIQFVLFFIALIAFFGYFSGMFIDVTRDAGKYATVSKEIFQNGNLINLTVHGKPYDQKPPLLFWLGALGFSIGGISNFWFKFPILLLVFAGIYWTYRLGKSLYNERVGKLAGLFMFFSFIVSMYSMDIHTDTLMQVFVTLALWQLFEFIKTRKNKHWIFGFIAIGLAMLSKGPYGAAIPGVAVIGHLLFTKQYKFLLDYRWYVGTILAFLVVSPALIGLWNQFGWTGIKFFFIDNNLGRVTGNYVHAGIYDPTFFIHNLLYLFLPWSIIFYIAAFCDIKRLIKTRFKAYEYFTFTGIGVFFILLSASRSQLPNYIFGIVPLMAIVLAKWVNIALKEKSKLALIFSRVQEIVVSLLWIFIAAIIFYLFSDVSVWVIILGALILAVTVAVYFKTKDTITKLMLPSFSVIAYLILLLNIHVFPYIFSYQAPPKAARYFNQHSNAGDRLYNYQYGQYELFFYSEPEASMIYSENELDSISAINGSWIFTNQEGLKIIDSKCLNPDSVITYQHLALNRGGRFINPKKREAVLKPMYLVKF